MAKSFGVSRQYMEQQLFMFISSGVISCKIDGCRGVVEMAQKDKKNQLYKKLLHDGDILMNRVQKLSRVIN
jgi:26S proteasome regulatory subunit N7